MFGMRLSHVPINPGRPFLKFLHHLYNPKCLPKYRDLGPSFLSQNYTLKAYNFQISSLR